jgi:hypothetical protein
VGHAQSLDIRTPIGGLFAVLGVLLVVFSFIRPEAAQTIAGNIDRSWGFVMLAFGAAMLYLARRAGRTAGPLPTPLSPEGNIIERIEHRSGLERE